MIHWPLISFLLLLTCAAGGRATQAGAPQDVLGEVGEQLCSTSGVEGTPRLGCRCHLVARL